MVRNVAQVITLNVERPNQWKMSETSKNIMKADCVNLFCLMGKDCNPQLKFRFPV